MCSDNNLCSYVTREIARVKSALSPHSQQTLASYQNYFLTSQQLLQPLLSSSQIYDTENCRASLYLREMHCCRAKILNCWQFITATFIKMHYKWFKGQENGDNVADKSTSNLLHRWNEFQEWTLWKSTSRNALTMQQFIERHQQHNIVAASDKVELKAWNKNL